MQNLVLLGFDFLNADYRKLGYTEAEIAWQNFTHFADTCTQKSILL